MHTQSTSANQYSDALIIFVKNPIPGKVKTRLAQHVGSEEATRVYRQLLIHTEQVARSVRQVQRFVDYADEITQNDGWHVPIFQKRLQSGQDLGERMQRAFSACFEAGFIRVVIIGSDCLELTDGHITQAYAQLNEVDVIIGPATDGGYYLLGMKQLYSELFTGIAWSSNEVLRQTVQKAVNLQLTYQLLAPLSDVDTLEDYERITNRLKND